MTGPKPTFYSRCGALSTCAAAPASHWSSCGTHPPISSGRTGATLTQIWVLLRGLFWLLSGNVHSSQALRGATLLIDFRRIESADEISNWTAEATHLFLLSFRLGKRAHYTLASGLVHQCTSWFGSELISVWFVIAKSKILLVSGNLRGRAHARPVSSSVDLWWWTWRWTPHWCTHSNMAATPCFPCRRPQGSLQATLGL